MCVCVCVLGGGGGWQNNLPSLVGGHHLQGQVRKPHCISVFYIYLLDNHGKEFEPCLIYLMDPFSQMTVSYYQPI